MLVTTTYFDQLVMTLLPHDGTSEPLGPLNGAKLALISANITATPDTAWADLTEADFSGYAQSAAVVWGSGIIEGDGSVSLIGGSVQFTVGTATPVVGNTIFGAALIDGSTPPKLLGLEIFPEPIPMTSTGDGFVYVPKMNYGIANANQTGAVVS